ncbi:MAG: hypothetical protein JWM99_2211 [Verrucomicrobiales bacterium]|nr:hypothetical protein [Verrucomicrobiales bacterium]
MPLGYQLVKSRYHSFFKFPFVYFAYSVVKPSSAGRQRTIVLGTTGLSMNTTPFLTRQVRPFTRIYTNLHEFTRIYTISSALFRGEGGDIRDFFFEIHDPAR